MISILEGVAIRGTGARLRSLNRHLAGKTGTTNENKDAWFIGFTPDIVTGVFVGNDDNTSTGLTGGSVPARIWKDMMKVATEKYGSPEFDYPEVDLNAVSSSTSDEEAAEATRTEGSIDNTAPAPDFRKEHTPVKQESENTVTEQPAENFKSIPVQLTVPAEVKKLKPADREKEGVIPMPAM